MDENLSLLRCQFALLNQPCTFGESCRFVHDDSELQQRKAILQERRSLKARLARGVCRAYASGSDCRYGDSCKFAHVSQDVADRYAEKVERKRLRQVERRAPPPHPSDIGPNNSESPAIEESNSLNKIKDEMRSSSLYEHYTDLFEEAIGIMLRWQGRFQYRPDIWRRFIKARDNNMSRIVKEFCEAVPVIARVMKSVSSVDNVKVTLLDLCSGFGYLSMFLSELLPASAVNRIILIDNQWSHNALQRDIEEGKRLAAAASGGADSAVEVGVTTTDSAEGIKKNPEESGDDSKYINSDHITGVFFDQWPIPLVASKQNFKSSSCVRSMQRAVVDRALREGELIILGIHLCGVLSLRAVDLFNNNRQSVRLFALKPCCLPGLVYAQRNEIFKIGNHAFSAHEVCAPGKFEAQSKTKGRWNGPPRNHLQSKFLLWAEHLSRGVVIDHVREADFPGRILWDKCVEHVNIQSIGHQNKYIWAEKTVIQCSTEADPSRANSGAVSLETSTGTDELKDLAALKRERKSCGHDCYPSSTSKCCPCSDLRPMLDGDVYPCYTDGVGWMSTGSRDAGYCPICNPKSYGAWKQRIQREREEKIALKLKEAERKDSERVREEEDKFRAASLAEGRDIIKFEYSNGDVYEGAMINGERYGWGKLTYEDGAVYEGNWEANQHSGHGVKDWCDGIVYVGEWKNGMMHGKGKYAMADGTELEGYFEEDEFSHYL